MLLRNDEIVELISNIGEKLTLKGFKKKICGLSLNG